MSPSAQAHRDLLRKNNTSILRAQGLGVEQIGSTKSTHASPTVDFPTCPHPKEVSELETMNPSHLLDKVKRFQKK